MGTIKLSAPDGATSLSIGEQVYTVDADGCVSVPEESAIDLIGFHGYVVAGDEVIQKKRGRKPNAEKA